MPEEWDAEIICLIYKKKNNLNYNNCRGITLLNTVYKVLTLITSERLNNLVGKDQGNTSMVSNQKQVHLINSSDRLQKSSADVKSFAEMVTDRKRGRELILEAKSHIGVQCWRRWTGRSPAVNTQQEKFILFCQMLKFNVFWQTDVKAKF